MTSAFAVSFENRKHQALIVNSIATKIKNVLFYSTFRLINKSSFGKNNKILILMIHKVNAPFKKDSILFYVTKIVVC